MFQVKNFAQSHSGDLCDGIFCAYLAYYFWYWGGDRSLVMGDTTTGYVVLPRCPLPHCEVNQNIDN